MNFCSSLSKHFKTDPATLVECIAALPHLYKAMNALERGSGNEVIVTPELHRSMTAILARHRDVDEANFQKIMTRVENDLNFFRGMSKNKVLSRFLNKETRL